MVRPIAREKINASKKYPTHAANICQATHSGGSWRFLFEQIILSRSEVGEESKPTILMRGWKLKFKELTKSTASPWK